MGGVFIGVRNGVDVVHVSSRLFFDVAVAVAVAVELQPLETQPFVYCRKWIKNERCLSEASFVHFPFFAVHKRAPEGQVCGRLSFAYLFFGEAKKSR